MRFHFPFIDVLVGAGVTMFLFAGGAVAQEPGANSPVKQASFTYRESDENASSVVRFGRQPSRVGDRIEQSVSLEMRLRLSMRRGNELVGDNQTTVHTQQRRVIVATAVEGGTMMAARVQYPEATKQLVAAEAPTLGHAGDGAAKTGEVVAQYQPVAQAVQGKTYFCQREPGEKGRLIVTDEAGNRPAAEEYEIVAAQMKMIGRPNPLAQFLAGREVKIGESFELPKEVASRVFNLGDKFGEVTRFELTLQKIGVENGTKCAEFLANVEAAANGASQMRLQVEGPLVVQADSCRAVRIELNGPVGMSETRGSYSTAHQVIGTGHLKTSISTTYREAQPE